MAVREVVGLLTGVLVLAGLAYMVAKGDSTKKILDSSFSGFAGLVKAATGQGPIGGF